MRIVAVVIVAALASGAALAQSSTPPMAPAPATPAAAAAAGEGIGRDDYIAKARNAAEKRAAKRFDAMDANHDGILTKDEIAAYRAAHPRKKRSAPDQ
jgi:hypothetical protein